MKDLIYRQDAIGAIDVKNVNEGIVSALQSIIEELPPAQQWIPVTERLPEKRKSVLISTNNGFTGEGCYWETREHVIWKGYRWDATYWDEEVVAWMPLPEPYRGDADE
jgi:hypothetical protein